MPDKVQQILGVATVVQRKGRVETDGRRVLAQDARADGVEGASPCQAGDQRRNLLAKNLAGDPFDATGHLDRCPPGERHHQDAPGIRAPQDRMGNAVRQRAGLTGAGSGNDQQGIGDRPGAVQDCASLGFVQPVEISGGGRGGGGYLHTNLKHVAVSFARASQELRVESRRTVRLD